MRRKLLAVVLLAMMVVGCDDRREPATAPATQSSSLAALPSPVPAAVLLIDDRATTFPAPRLRLAKADSGTSAVLFTDAADGNAIYLEMDLDIDDPTDVASAAWRFEAASPERVDSPVGLSMDEGRTRLQPLDVSVNFSRDALGVWVTIAGKFVRFDAGDTAAAGSVVGVSGQVQVRAVE